MTQTLVDSSLKKKSLSFSHYKDDNPNFELVSVSEACEPYFFETIQNLSSFVIDSIEYVHRNALRYDPFEIGALTQIVHFKTQFLSEGENQGDLDFLEYRWTHVFTQIKTCHLII